MLAGIADLHPAGKGAPILAISHECMVLLKYRFLAGCGEKSQCTALHWELEYITSVRIAFHPDRNELSGNTACNPFSGKLMLSGNTLRITAPRATATSTCRGEGETRFLEMLQKADRYAVDGGSTLTFFQDAVPVMRFRRLE